MRFNLGPASEEVFAIDFILARIYFLISFTTPGPVWQQGDGCCALIPSRESLAVCRHIISGLWGAVLGWVCQQKIPTLSHKVSSLVGNISYAKMKLQMNIWKMPWVLSFCKARGWPVGYGIRLEFEKPMGLQGSLGKLLCLCALSEMCLVNTWKIMTCFLRDWG